MGAQDVRQWVRRLCTTVGEDGRAVYDPDKQTEARDTIRQKALQKAQKVLASADPSMPVDVLTGILRPLRVYFLTDEDITGLIEAFKKQGEKKPLKRRKSRGSSK